MGFVNGRTRKGWAPEVLTRFDVAREGAEFRLPNGETYFDDGRKADAPKGAQRGLWPDPADVPGADVLVVEGRADVLSAAVLGYPAISLPSARNLRGDEGARIARGRRRVIVVPDCDGPGRRCAQRWAEQTASYGPACLADLDPGRQDGFDVGDLLVEAIERYGDDGPDAARRFLVLRIEQAETIAAPGGKLRALDTLHLLTTEPAPLDWLADGVLCRGELTMFGGREKTGKSLVQLALAVCMASGGGELAGITVKPARVAVVDAENGEREVHRRLRAMGLGAAHAGNLTVFEARGFELRDDLGELRAVLDSFRPDVILLDSFRSLWGGNERDEAEVAAALDPLRDLVHDRHIGASLTHHAQKGGEEYRGSTGIGAAVEWVVMLSREREDPERRTRRRLSNPLGRFAPEREDRWLSIHAADGEGGHVTVDTADPYRASRERARDDRRDQVADVLTETPQSERTIAVVAGMARTTTQRYLAQLAEDGEAEQTPEGWVAHRPTPYSGGPVGHHEQMALQSQEGVAHGVAQGLGHDDGQAELLSGLDHPAAEGLDATTSQLGLAHGWPGGPNGVGHPQTLLQSQNHGGGPVAHESVGPGQWATTPNGSTPDLLAELQQRAGGRDYSDNEPMVGRPADDNRRDWRQR
jgi:hypothetical protein